MSALGQSRHRSPSNQCPLYPQKRTLVERVGMSALCQKRTLSSFLFDYLIGANKQRRRNVKTQRLRRLEIYDHFEFSRLLDWYLRRLFALENLVDVESYSLKHQRVIWRIAKQHPRSRHLCSVPHDCDVLFDCKLGDCASFIPI